MSKIAFTREIRFGGIGGFVGMLAMDIVMVVTFLIVGEDADTYLSTIEEGAETLLDLIGISMDAGALIVIPLHYLIGLVTGFAFGVGVLYFDRLRGDIMRLGTVLVFIVEEIFCYVFFLPLIFDMSVSELILFFSSTSLFHSIFAVVLAWLVNYGVQTNQ